VHIVLNLPRGGRYLALIGLTGALSFGAFSTAAVASASTATTHASVSAAPDFKSPEECGGDVCMVLTVNGSPAGAEIVAGANSNTFTGYFHMTGPGGPFDPANSPTKTWAAHGLGSGNDDFASQRLAPDHGTYCVSAFQGGVSIGKACATY
jgi:hypothetical protein